MRTPLPSIDWLFSRIPGLAILAVAAAALAAPTAWAENEEIDSDESDPPQIVAPSLGRPTFVAPGEAFDVALDRVPPNGEVQGFLVRGAARRPLQLLSVTGRIARFQVDPATALRVHDLEVVGGATTLRAEHCVSVWRPSERIRIVQICNPPSVSEAAARAFVSTANLLAPTLIVFAGAPDAPTAAGFTALLREFDAPALVAAGPGDDLAEFGRAIAASPIGAVDIGDYRALALCDHAAAPLESDLAQVRWVEQMLARGSSAGMCLALSHDPHPNLLRHWKQHGVLDRAIQRGRLGLWLTAAGSIENATEREVVNAARPLLFSPAPIELGQLPSLRVIDIERNRVRLPLVGDRPTEPLPIAPSQLAVSVERTGNDVLIEAASGLRAEIGGLAVWVSAPKRGSQRPPTCRGARLEETFDGGSHWECRLGFDLPTQGRVQVSLLAGS